jgi:hypothetical protein
MWPALQRRIGSGVAVVLSVALLTLLFSFLGTITAAAVLGMMLGFSRASTIQVLLISSVFPSVSLAFSYASRSDLTAEKSSGLALLCFGTFWGCYLTSRALAFFERGDQGERPTDPGAVPRGSREAIPTEPAERGLQELQGVWSRVYASDGRDPPAKRIEIQGDRLALALWDGAVDRSSVSHGRIRLAQVGPIRTLTVTDVRTESAHGASGVTPWMWLYRVHGDTLSIVTNFDTSDPSQALLLESYRQLFPVAAKAALLVIFANIC